MRQLIIVAMGAGGIILLAGAMRNRGWHLADQICGSAAISCDHPGWVMVGIAVLLFAATIQTIVKT